MYSIIFLSFAAFIFSLALTPVVRHFAKTFGLVDRPDDVRKFHDSPIPKLGGVAIVISYVLAYVLFLSSGFTTIDRVKAGIPIAERILPAILIVFVTGFLDDIRPLRPFQKLLGQISAAVIAYFAGVQITGLDGISLPPAVSFSATVFWIVLCTNAVNLIDGMDGLATGVSVFATATILAAGLTQHNLQLVLAVAPLLGCLLGFLRYNFNPASIFLGDSGSLAVGFFLACCSVIWSHKSTTVLGMTAPAVALSLPLLDTALSIARRFLRGRPIFKADRGHIHHKLLDRGLKPRAAAVLTYVFCAFASLIAVTLTYRGFEAIAAILFLTLAWLMIRHLGYIEFSTMRRMLSNGEFRRYLNTNIMLKTLEDDLKLAKSPDECWRLVRESADGFGFHAVHMRLGEKLYRHHNAISAPSWTLTIPLPNKSSLELSRAFGNRAEHSAVAHFADSIRRGMESKDFNELNLAATEELQNIDNHGPKEFTALYPLDAPSKVRGAQAY